MCTIIISNWTSERNVDRKIGTNINFGLKEKPSVASLIVKTTPNVKQTPLSVKTGYAIV